jgi:hypothetical protein
MLFTRNRLAQTETISTVPMPKTYKTGVGWLRPISEKSTITLSTKGMETIETYPLNEPYAYARIIKDTCSA